MSIQLLGLSGSLRHDSLNTAVLRTLNELLPEDASLVLHDYRDVPLFDGDTSSQAPGVARLKSAIAAADGLLLATPEYNYSVPGVFKNAIDHASRPAYRSVFAGKPTAVLSASMSGLGGVRAQQHLKTILLGMGTPVFPWPEVAVGAAHRKVTDGRIVDVDTREVLASFLAAFVAEVRGRAGS